MSSTIDGILRPKVMAHVRALEELLGGHGEETTKCLKAIKSLFPRELHVDGAFYDTSLGYELNFQGDGQFPPFVVFDADQQENISKDFATREEAGAERQRIINS